MDNYYVDELTPVAFAHTPVQTLNTAALVNSACCHEPDERPVSGDMLANVRYSDIITEARVSTVLETTEAKRELANKGLVKITMISRYGKSLVRMQTPCVCSTGYYCVSCTIPNFIHI